MFLTRIISLHIIVLTQGLKHDLGLNLKRRLVFWYMSIPSSLNGFQNRLDFVLC